MSKDPATALQNAEIAYTQLNIGHLSRNAFWGEPMDRPSRTAICCSTLVELADGSFLLVDPGLPYAHMREIVFNRRGIPFDAIRWVFLTHFHGDHMVDLHRYAHCGVYASAEEITRSDTSLPVPVEPLGDRFPGIRATPLPGHTKGLAGLSFVSGGRKVLIAGDAVMTRDYFLAGEGFPNSVDAQSARESIRYAAEHFDIIVPGHDVQFFVSRPGGTA